MSLKEKKNYVVLVNDQGQTLGYEEKLKVHQEGVLHLAFSIFILNPEGEMLLQQRAWEKYHFAGLWSNACCSHPVPEEELYLTMQRRLREEMGFDTALTEAFSFIYRCRDEISGLIEHEWDQVFVGVYAGEIIANPQEVAAYRWISLEALDQEVHLHPDRFTEWFKQAMVLLKQKKLLPVTR